ncbi:hypothetical protein ASPZODRAFT_958567 [Penicilliopsis zonata CBS 506.65]|uniref:Protein-lysine N-methyltransferase EFM6 n=1 Tax=Penicilliopsis zonata CBS 506.65 TaxID=1073090 RepID=A0A1L9SQX4_9EURO|nr:hypothetical protein ASPZODRAFT_958567 [Penicilliopsis zonata CBS 506.65]OJJ49507.1 hypothetical protein ASPZODRAFT_958567 [Penicilliopsis zonata CBS 506.65]
MDDITSSRPESPGIDASFSLSESLVPPRDLKTAGISSVTFDGLLEVPLHLKEDLKEGCGGQLWPAGMVLAKYLLRQHKSDLIDKTIVELGAGGGLVGLAVARGCDVNQNSIYLTDQKPMLELMQTNIQLNNASSTAMAGILNWGEDLPDFIPTHPAVVLAADCVYFEPAFPLLIDTLQQLLGPESVCYFCYKRRRRADIRFMKQARKVFHIEEIQDDPDSETYKKENISLHLIRLKDTTTHN